MTNTCVNLVLYSVLAVILISSVNGKKKQAELQSIVEFMPEKCSEKAASGDTVAVHYTGTLEATGATFDSSRQPGREPIKFTLGKQMVIKGWELGIMGMCVGEKRKLIIPHHLAYGVEGRPPVIPGEATLVFDTELISIAREPALTTDSLGRVAGFIFVPMIVGVVLYHLYRKITNSPSKKDLKEERRKKKRK
ncbi:uncharacterized protein LOC141909986 [Tubulanus polymorphus]|uniref:uncharacterized protein LOC141909986 n=1 Tax=Tubulanus polymorphus TaxID=672921 RepID=UPI003DA237A2